MNHISRFFTRPRNRATLPTLVVAIILTCSACMTSRPFVYPQTRTVNQVDDYHGVKVADPYRWLEDDNAEETKSWVEQQNRVTGAYLAGLKSRPYIQKRLTELWNYERYGIPTNHGGQYFVLRNDGLQNQSVLYRLASLTSEPRVVLDPNQLSRDGTVALSGIVISRDAQLVAYGTSTSGSDWQEWRVRNVESGKDLSDHIRWVKFSSVSWLPGGEGFYYSRFDEPSATNALKGANYFHKLYFHRIGTDQSADRLVYERQDQKEWRFNGRVTEDGQYLIISVARTGTKSQIFYKSLKEENAPAIELITGFDASYRFINNDGGTFWFETDLDAPRGRVIAIDIQNSARDQWRTLIAQTGETLRDVNLVGDRWIATYLKDARSLVKIHDRNGKPLQDLDLPGIGTVAGFSGKKSDKETFFSFAGYTSPDTIYRYEPGIGKTELFKRPRVGFNPDLYETRQVFYSSKDGTRVPMFITHRKGVKLDGNNPTLLYGYGGFNIPMVPNFSVANLVWMEMGGVYAVANIRGGGEYGEEWHRAGTKLQKQNVFDDFIAAAEWLIREKYTRSSRLAIEGRSNGGLLVGACLTQRPDLFGATLPGVGVMDMLRFHKFTIGWAWTSDYGSAENPGEFTALHAYSPLHNLKPGTRYPATLVTTADHDDRVVPAHSFKFAATLQAAQGGREPVLIRIDTKAGHGAGKPVAKQIEEVTDKWAFLVEELGVNLP